MILLRLFFEFCKIGLFSVGGGLATIPFLADLGERTGWFTSGELANMIAISESTPGPLGVNMATYVGFASAGVAGGVVATLGLVFPCVVVILIVAAFLKRFRQSKVVDGVFYGLRAASVALITSAMLQVAEIAFTRFDDLSPNSWDFHWMAFVLAAVIFVLIKFTPLKKLHPICFIAIAAVVGVICKM